MSRFYCKIIQSIVNLQQFNEKNPHKGMITIKSWFLLIIELLLEVLLLNQVKHRMEACYSELILSAKLCAKKLSSGTYDLCNLATFALNFPNMYMNSMQSDIFNISLFSMTIFIFKMLNLNVSSLLLCIQWLWHWLDLVITAN